jgi:hypothetical protein
MHAYVQSKGGTAMNQFFYESRGKEKVKGLMEEGMRRHSTDQGCNPGSFITCQL